MLAAGPLGPPPGRALGAAVRDACAALGARVSTCSPSSARTDVAGEAVLDVADEPVSNAADEAALEVVGEAALDAAVRGAVRAAGKIDLLAVDGAGLFAHGLAQGGDGHAALRACVDGAWNATRATVNHAFLLAAEPGGRVVYTAPAPDAGEYADAACAGLENLARTLSIEWARHGITTVAIAPGVHTAADEVATLVAYIASPAGSYFSGCLLDLRGARPA